jgi:hypothetical protein
LHTHQSQWTLQKQIATALALPEDPPGPANPKTSAASNTKATASVAIQTDDATTETERGDREILTATPAETKTENATAAHETPRATDDETQAATAVTAVVDPAPATANHETRPATATANPRRRKPLRLPHHLNP